MDDNKEMNHVKWNDVCDPDTTPACPFDTGGNCRARPLFAQGHRVVRGRRRVSSNEGHVVHLCSIALGHILKVGEGFSEPKFRRLFLRKIREIY